MLSRLHHGDICVRKWQINTLWIFNSNVVVVEHNKEYRVEFMVGDTNMSLDVVLPPTFPHVTPIIFVNPSISHPWVAKNTNNVLYAPGLLSFTPNSDLGRVVQVIIREFQKKLSCAEDSQPTSPSSSLWFPELNGYSIEELEEILVNDDLQDKILYTTPLLVEIDFKAEEVICGIEEIAEGNIIKHGILDSLKANILDKISTVVSMKMRYQELTYKYQQLSKMYQPNKLMKCLKEAAIEADNEADCIAEEFLDGRVPVERFVSEFSAKRALAQHRRTREERLAHQLSQLKVSTSPENKEVL